MISLIINKTNRKTFVSYIFIERIPDYRLYLPIRNDTFDIFDSTLHPIETTIFQLRIVASQKSGLPLSAFRLVTEQNNELFDHIRLSQYDIGRCAILMMTFVRFDFVILLS